MADKADIPHIIPKFETFQLTRQLLWPLVILLLVLAGTSVVGSSLLLYNSLSASIDHQLDHAQKMVYRDLKNREMLLADLLVLLSLKPASIPTTELEAEARAYQPLLDLHLYDSRSKLSEPLRALSETVVQSKTGLRYITYDKRTDLYYLTLAAPAKPPRNALLMQFPINRRLLKLLAERYLCDFSLYSEEGRLMASSSDKGNPDLQLSEDQLARISKSNHLYTSKIEDVDYRSLYVPLPLGSDGILYLATSHSLDNLNGLLLTHSWRLLMTVILALALGAFIYYHRLKHALTPLKNLLETIHQVSRGNLSSRTELTDGNCLNELGNSFNLMLDQLETLIEKRLENEKNAVLTQETLKYNNHLKKKNLEIEKANILLKEQYEELTALFQVSRSLTAALDQNLLFEKIFSVFRESLHCDRIVLLLYQAGDESLEVIKTTGLDATTVKGLSFKLGEGISGMVAASMQPIYSPDLSTDDRNLSYKGRWVSSGSLLSMPMVLQGQLIGVLNIHHQQPDAFSPIAQQMAQAIADQAAISIENSRLYEKTRALSATDDLTGLANRRQFQDFLQREWTQARRYQDNFSLLMIDIDNFKAYNDIHGHLKGDIVLKKVAALLLQNTRGIDLVARFDGEEFVLLLPKANREGSLAVANKLCRCIENEYFAGMEASQPQKKLTISIGVASYPTDSTDIYELVNLADEALYQAKHQGRNCVVAWKRENSSLSNRENKQPSLPPT